MEKVQGIPAIAFNLDPDNFANTTVCPDNQCYSNNLPSGVQVGNSGFAPACCCHYIIQLPIGLMTTKILINSNLKCELQNVTQCKMESPTFVSRPHFYLVSIALSGNDNFSSLQMHGVKSLLNLMPWLWTRRTRCTCGSSSTAWRRTRPGTAPPSSSSQHHPFLVH